MSTFKFDGRYLVSIGLRARRKGVLPMPAVSLPPLADFRRYTLRCLVEWLPGSKRYRIAFLLSVPGLVAEERVSRTHIRRWLLERQAQYLGKTHQLNVH